jgi:hypothetical protein
MSGETFAAVLARAGSAADAPERDLPWLLAQGFWIGSTAAAPYDALNDRIVALTQRGEPVDIDDFDEITDRLVYEVIDATNAAALVGYALGRTEGMPDAMRLAAAMAFAAEWWPPPPAAAVPDPEPASGAAW